MAYNKRLCVISKDKKHLKFKNCARRNMKCFVAVRFPRVMKAVERTTFWPHRDSCCRQRDGGRFRVKAAPMRVSTGVAGYESTSLEWREPRSSKHMQRRPRRTL